MAPDADIPAAQAARTGEAVWVDAIADGAGDFPGARRHRLPQRGGDPAGGRGQGRRRPHRGLRQRSSSRGRRQALPRGPRRAGGGGARASQALRQRASSRRQAEQDRREAEQDRRRSVELARALQTSLLPPRLPDVPGLDLGARYHPALAGLEVGGDFYDVFDTGGDWAVVIGDVCGKGPEAAALTALARYTIRSVAMDLRHPAQVLRKLNETLLHHQLEERFCTVAYGRVVPSVGGMRVSVCRGGHPPPLVVRVGRRDRADRRRRRRHRPLPRDPAVGGDGAAGPGDSLVFYTDGVTEARRGSEQFGDEQLARGAVGRAPGRRPPRSPRTSRLRSSTSVGPSPGTTSPSWCSTSRAEPAPPDPRPCTDPQPSTGPSTLVEDVADHDAVAGDHVLPDLGLVQAGRGS